MKNIISNIILLISSGGLIYSLMSFKGKIISQNPLEFDSPGFFGGYYYPLEYKVIATVSVILIVTVLLFRNKKNN